MRLQKLTALALMTTSFSLSARASCPAPTPSVQKIFDEIEAKHPAAAVDAITYADESVSANTRNAACETFYHVAFRTGQKGLLETLKAMGLGIADPNANDPLLGVSLSSYVFRFGSLAQIRTAIENGADLPSFPGSDRNLVNAAIGLSNAAALRDLLKDGTFRIREMANAFVAFRQRSMDERARFTSLVDAKMIAFVGSLRTELHSKDVASSDLPLAAILAALESGVAPGKALVIYARSAARLSPSAARDLSGELSSLIGTRGASVARVKELVETYGMAWAGTANAEDQIRTAIDSRNGAVARYLLSRPEGSAAIRGSTSNRALAAAIRDSDVETVKALVAAGADLSKPADFVMPLTLAVQYQNVEMVKLLLSLKASPNPSVLKGSRPGDLPLCAAAAKGDLEIVKVLVAAKADLNASPQPPLFCALLQGATDTFEYLLSAGADPRVKDGNGSTLLNLAAERDDLALVKSLLAAKVDPSSAGANRSGEKQTPLSYAVSNKDVEMVKTLLDAHANPNVPLGSTKAPYVFNVAVEQGDIGMVKLLIAAHAKADAPAERTPIQVAIEAKNRELVDLLISAQLPLNQVSIGENEWASDHNTALHTAVMLAEDAYRNDTDAISFYTAIAWDLLRAGASTRVKDGAGRTASSYATFKIWGPDLVRLK